MSVNLSDYAQAAVEHAADRHKLVLGSSDVQVVDQVLDRERESGSREEREAISLCYGAWFGELLCASLKGEWVGLSEPTPPRVRIRGIDYSPIDAVKRRLESTSAPKLSALFEQLQKDNRIAERSESDSRKNLAVWERLSADRRFVADLNKQLSREESLASLDPWLVEDGPLDGKRVLCLAAGGGTHGPLLASAGAEVTVVDFSSTLLAIDRRVADANGLRIETLTTSMLDLSGLASQSFDIVVQPVSACYVQDLSKVYAEVHRVLRLGGLYLVQHKQPASLQADSVWGERGYGVRIPSASGRHLPNDIAFAVNREEGACEFLHPLESLLGGLCRQGFTIEGFVEPPRGDAWAPPGTAEHRAGYLPPYLKIKARRIR